MEKMTFKANKKDKLLNILTSRGFSYAYASKLLRNKDVRVNDCKMKDNILLEEDDEITVFYTSDAITLPQIEKVFEDENILIVNKPAGIEIEGENSLCSMLGALAVHRLDRNTTGLVMLAKNKPSQDELSLAIKDHLITKKYLAEVVGPTNFKNYLMKAYLEKDEKLSQVKIFEKPTKKSVEIQTIFNTLKSNPSSSIVECTLITGKTHQIRASLAYLNHAIIGDGKYGKNENNKKFKEKTQKLHCFYLKFNNLKNNLKYLNQREIILFPKWYKK